MPEAYNPKVIEDRGYIRRNRNISRGIELAQRDRSRRNGSVLTIPVVGQIAAGLPIPVVCNHKSQGLMRRTLRRRLGRE